MGDDEGEERKRVSEYISEPRVPSRRSFGFSYIAAVYTASTILTAVPRALYVRIIRSNECTRHSGGAGTTRIKVYDKKDLPLQSPFNALITYVLRGETVSSAVLFKCGFEPFHTACELFGYLANISSFIAKKLVLILCRQRT